MEIIINSEFNKIITPQAGISFAFLLTLYVAFGKKFVSEKASDLFKDKTYLWRRGNRGINPEIYEPSEKIMSFCLETLMHFACLIVIFKSFAAPFGMADAAEKISLGLCNVGIMLCALMVYGLFLDIRNNRKYRKQINTQYTN